MVAAGASVPSAVAQTKPVASTAPAASAPAAPEAQGVAYFVNPKDGSLVFVFDPTHPQPKAVRFGGRTVPVRCGAATFTAPPTAARPAGSASAAPSSGPAPSASAAISPNRRGYGQGKYALDLDNVKAGWISDLTGGNAVADVVTEKIGGDFLARKSVGTIPTQELSVQCGSTAVSKGLYDWVDSGFRPDKKPQAAAPPPAASAPKK
jgi:hypothetical protein